MVLPWLGAALGGVVGASVWAAVAYFLNLEIGWIAWAIGGICGFGARWIAPQQLSFSSGAGAAAIAVAAIVGGKYLSVDLMVRHAFGEMETQFSSVTDEMVTMVIADQVMEEFHQDGRPIRWAPDQKPGEHEGKASYPADVWAEAESRFETLTPAEVTEVKTGMRQEFLASLESSRAEAKSEGFRESFGALDLLFVALAIGTAFKIASGAQVAEA